MAVWRTYSKGERDLGRFSARVEGTISRFFRPIFCLDGGCFSWVRVLRGKRGRGRFADNRGCGRERRKGGRARTVRITCESNCFLRGEADAKMTLLSFREFMRGRSSGSGARRGEGLGGVGCAAAS